MGIDDEWFAQDERGWRDPKRWVCQRCVGDDGYLLHLVRKNLAFKTCSYCGSQKRKAAALSALMDVLVRGIKYSYNDEANAGCPYDKDFSIEYLSSEDVLRHVLDAQGLDWSEALIKDVAESLTNTGWVDAPDGDWMGAHHHERLHWSWTSFSNAVKHHSRFHFQFNRRLHRYGDDLIGVHEMLPFLGRLIRRHRMVRPLPAKIPLFRVRPGTHPHTVEDLGAPPKEQASAGRMNPAGVPYLYLAFDEKTALAETRASQGQKVTVSQWSPNRDLHVIDLSHVPNIPSIFSEKRQEHEVAQFLYAFRDEISKPVAHDGSEHIEYVPTQVVSEYFSQVFKHGSGKHVDGLIYPSAVASEGKNLVVFPTYKTGVPQGGKQPFPMMHFETARTGRVFFNDHSVI